MNLVSTFAASVQRHPEKSALFWGERIYSYEELWNQTLAVSRQLESSFGVKPGDRVGLWLKNCPEFIPSLFGILQPGAVAVPINNFLKPAEVSYILQDAGIDVLITDAELGTHFPVLAGSRPGLRIFNTHETLASMPSNSARQNEQLHSRNGHTPLSNPAIDNSLIKESDLAVLIYTSGTTGKPKGA